MDFSRLLRYFNVLVRWRLLLLGVTLAAAAVFGYRYATTPRTYAATARLLYNSSHINMEISGKITEIIHERSRMKSLTTHMDMLGSLSIIELTVAALGGALDATQIVEGLSVIPDNTGGVDTDIILVSFTGPDPQLCIQVVNTHCAVYVGYQRETADKIYVDHMNVFDGAIERLAADLDAQLDTLVAFKQTNRVVAVDARMNLVASRHASVKQLLADTRQQITELSQKIDRLQNSLSKEELTVVEQVTFENKYLQLVQSKQLELTTLQASVTPDHPLAARLERQIESLEQTARTEAQAVPTVGRIIANPIRENIAREIITATIDKEVLSAKLGSLEIIAGTLEKNVAEMPRLEQQGRVLERNIESVAQMLRSLKQNRTMASLGGDTFESAVTVFEDPLEAVALPHPLGYRDLLGALFGALIGAIVLAILIEALKRGARDLDSLEKDTNCELLGIIPHSTTVSGPVSFSDKDPDIRLEPYRNLRIRLRQRIERQRAQVIMVAGACGHPQTASLAYNLGRAFAVDKTRVLVLGANLRQPKLGLLCGEYAAGGLARALTEKVSLISLLHSVDLPGLFVLPAGRTLRHPAELLGSAVFAALIKEARATMDLVLVEVPPVLEFSEGLAAAPFCDGALLVAQWHQTPVNALREANRKLQAIACPVIGLCVKGIAADRDYYHYLYGVLNYKADQYSYDGKPPVAVGSQPLFDHHSARKASIRKS